MRRTRVTDGERKEAGRYHDGRNHRQHRIAQITRSSVLLQGSTPAREVLIMPWQYADKLSQMVSQPARRITRALGIPKGSMASRITQLHISFAISCLVHEFEMFNVTRKDMGEFAFFMSQPVVITLEVWIQSAWKKATKAKGVPTYVGVWIGYVWVVAWMSISLPWYVKGFRDAGITTDAIFGRNPLDVGASLMQG